MGKWITPEKKRVPRFQRKITSDIAKGTALRENSQLCHFSLSYKQHHLNNAHFLLMENTSYPMAGLEADAGRRSAHGKQVVLLASSTFLV